MKIKNILHNAALRGWLLALALILAVTASAETHTPYTPTGSSVKESLNALTGTITISNTDVFLKTDGTDGKELVTNTYYKDGNGNTWYNKYSRGNISSYLDWKTAHGIAFKLNPGTYNITVEFQGKAEAALWIYSGDNHIGTYDSTKGETFEGVTSNYNTYTRTITVTNESCWWISNMHANNGIKIHSIKVEPVSPLSTQFPSGNGAITDNTFWYHNGGGGFGYNGEINAAPFYRYFNYKAGTYYAPTDDNKNVIINGDDSFKSYELRSGDAIGFRLSKNSQYRIKIYYHKVDASAPADLYVGENLNSGSRLGNWVKTTIKNDYGEDTDTRLRTYDISTGDNDVYWIKNDGDEINKPLYLGGFEILPYIDDKPSAEAFTGTWLVAEETATLANINKNNDGAGFVATAHGKVGLQGYAMAINQYQINGNKTVMINDKNTISVNIPAKATVTFKYTADAAADGVTISGYNFSESPSTNYNKFDSYTHQGEVRYTNASDAGQTIYIKGMSTNFAYLSGFTVKSADEASIDDVTPIEADYVWYPVAGKFEFTKAKVKTDDHTYLEKGFYVSKAGDDIMTESHKFFGEDRTCYRFNGSQIGFKVKSGKKGVINIYYKEEFNSNNGTERFLRLSENGTNCGTLVTEKINDTGTRTAVARYQFDTTNGSDKTYWITRANGEVWFLGYEVLFDEGDKGAADLTKDTPYTLYSTETLTNAIGTGTYNALKSTYGSAVGGASMVFCPGIAANTVMVGKVGNNWNGILVKMPYGCNVLMVKGYLDNASIKIYKGTAAAPASLVSEVTGSGEIETEVAVIGDSNDVYWITSDNAAGAFVTSVTPLETLSNLQPINVNYIYKVDSNLKNGVLLDTNGRIMFVDANSSARSNSGAKMKVLGTEVAPVAIENGTDFFAVKVDKSTAGVKTGYVKVYFNGGSSATHKMEELPLDKPLYAGWNSSYNPDTHVITFDGEGGGRGWWFGQEGEGARDLSAYNKINIELGEITGSPTLQLVVQSTNGASARFQVDSRGRLLGDLTDQSKWYTNSETGATFDITKIAQIYIQDNNTDATSATVEIKSARLMNKPIVIATDTDQDPANGYTEVFGGKIYDLPDGKLYEYPFDLSNASTVPQLIWITGAGVGTTNIAAIEVLYDSEHAKVVEWYVNKDTKMIVGSDDPGFTIDFNNQNLTYPAGYDEYVTFYMSAGRQAKVSFIMPEALREVYDWEKALENTSYKTNDDGYVVENEALAATYGKHTIEITELPGHNPNDISKQTNEAKYDRDKAQKPSMNSLPTSGGLYSWYSYTYDVPSSGRDQVPNYKDDNFWYGVVITATQKEDGKDAIETVGRKMGQWKIYMRFIAYKAPVATATKEGEATKSVSVTAGQGKNIYYTVDSSDPDNLATMDANDVIHSSTEKYEGGNVDVSKLNCIFKAAEYFETPCYFYEDISKGKDTKEISNVLKLVSKDLAVTNPDDAVVYVKNTTFGDKELFNQQAGGYMLTIPTGKDGYELDEYATNNKGEHFTEAGSKTDEQSNYAKKWEQPFNKKPLMYLTLGGRDHPCLTSTSGTFGMNGTDWYASKDGGLKTYLDSYQNKFDVYSIANPEWWSTSGSQDNNANTECNFGPGGAGTEDGGMFLTPIGGTMLRFEPEYDGVITVWLRQNGCLDNNNQENGVFRRRPVFVMDENGRIMRRSSIRPTATHYMGIDGVWAINSSMCEQRSQVEHTWLHEVAKQVYEKHPLYGNRFGSDFPNRWSESGHDHSGHILYGWWYKGFNLNATRSEITSAAHVSRFEYMEPELLYRSDGIYDMEMNSLGLENGFAKYGFELPNFQYVRYRIPVKAGKTYFIAGRGTKNGFSAIRFDALAPNTNMEAWKMNDLRFSDNPKVEENSDKDSDNYLKVTNDWNDNGSRDYKTGTKSSYDLSGMTETQVYDEYAKYEENGTLPTIDIYEDGTNNTSTINSNIFKGGAGNLGNLDGKTVNVKLHRTFKKGNWHPIILPFSLSETRVEQYFGEGTVVLYLDPNAHTLHNQYDAATGKSWISALKPALEGTKLSFTIHRYQMLYANTPAFICPTFTWKADKKKNRQTATTQESVSDITFKRVTLDGSNSHNDLGNGYFGYAISNDYEVVGRYDMKEESGDMYYVNNMTTDGKTEAQLIHSENKNGQKVTMKGTRVWIRQKAGAVNAAPIMTVGSRGFSDFEEDSDMSGISDIVTDGYTIEGYDIEDDSVYDLLGRKMGQGSLEGLQKGVYIFHGRKVYVK